jgi:hypothetical protein
LPFALDWYVDKVFVIERKGYHDRFKIIGSIDLGQNRDVLHPSSH